MYKRLVGWTVASCLILTVTLFTAKGLYNNSLKKQAFARHAQSINTARILIHEHMLRAVQDLHQLSAISCVQGYVESKTPAALERVHQTLLETSNIYGRYDQIRIIDLHGQELVRINNQESIASITPEDKLQNKLSRYFVQEGLKLHAGQVYISPIDLNMENGALEVPYKPMIRLVRLMQDAKGNPAGMLVLNYKAAGLLNQFRSVFSSIDRAMLINTDGYWLSNHESTNEWGWMFGREDLRIQNWHPELWRVMQTSVSGEVNIGGDLFSFERINIADIYEDTSHSRYIDDLGLTNDIKNMEWTALVQSEKEKWQARAVYNLTWFKFIVFGLFVIVTALAYLMTRNRYHRRVNRRLQRQQLINFRDLYENAPIGYITLAADGLITNVNQMLLSYLGYSREELVNKRNLKELVIADSSQQAHELLTALAGAREKQRRMKMLCKNGGTLEVSCNISSRIADAPTLQIGRCSVQDISEQALLEKKLQELAHHDPLTGVANRRHFEEFAIHEQQRAERNKTPLTLLTLDIDHFKKVNDTYGHDTGDKVLKALTGVCEEMIRATDILARFGGEEFVILLPDTNYKQGFEKAELLRQTLENTAVVLADESTLNFTVSFGVASLSTEHNSIEKLLKAADIALYEAKKTGRNKVC